ncbi:MAG: VWA-like domain-containing protein [Lachnospiraceae bacterium]|nr:VWA-like domain-containing protein [Lachnospiraceae bacterium]
MTNPDKRISELAKKVLDLARNNIIVKFRFFDRALAAVKLVPDAGIAGYVSSIGELKYDPATLLKDFKDDENFAVRLLLHVVFHNIFMHFHKTDKLRKDYWDTACDIAVENAILAAANSFPRIKDTEEKIVLSKLGKWIPQLSAERIYREFSVGGISLESAKEYARLFSMDIHHEESDIKKDEIVISEKDWEKIARRVSAELRSFSKDIKGGDTVLLNINEGVRKKYDYDDIVRRFAVMNEEIRVNPDEFDYIYYMYGLTKYKNMPLIEPLEYTDEKKIKEFVIAIDTSASVRGSLVEGFLTKTYDLLMSSSSFSQSMNVHIIQCDSDVTSDVIIKDRNDLMGMGSRLKVKGFGATDYRPVFEYVADLRQQRKLTDLKGLIYFTDGYGIYPENPPGYDVMFVFDRQDDFRPPVPGWTIVTILES